MPYPDKGVGGGEGGGGGGGGGGERGGEFLTKKYKGAEVEP